jgi:phosphosulfolactate synthase
MIDPATNPLASFIPPRCSEKPRARGITMIAEWGLPPAAQADLLTVAAPYIDLAKIAVGIGALLPLDVLRHKLDVYTAAQITPFPGGQFLEYAVQLGRVDEYLAATAAAGYRCVEVSDNLLEISIPDKAALIRKAIEEYGLAVLGEVGKKEGGTAGHDLADDAAACLEAGASRVFLEAADFFAGDVDATELERIVGRCGEDPLIFELPGPWIEGVTLSHVQIITRWLLERFGADVNIANVSTDGVLKLEALRTGLGVNAGSELDEDEEEGQ